MNRIGLFVIITMLTAACRGDGPAISTLLPRLTLPAVPMLLHSSVAALAKPIYSLQPVTSHSHVPPPTSLYISQSERLFVRAVASYTGLHY